jgi:hypothetical protein
MVSLPFLFIGTVPARLIPIASPGPPPLQPDCTKLNRRARRLASTAPLFRSPFHVTVEAGAAVITGEK